MKIIEEIKRKAANPGCEAPVKIAFLGDSVTHGCFEVIEKRNGEFDCIYDFESSYSNRLKQKIEAVFENCPVAVINAGISGATAMQSSERVERDIIACNPALVVVCFGLNDVNQPGGLPEYLNGLTAIFEKLSAAGLEHIFMTPNMLCTYVSAQIQSDWLRNAAEACASCNESGKMDEFMAAAVSLCRQRSIPICDCYSDWKKLYNTGADVTQLLCNYVNHPNRDMHELFASRLFDSIFLQQ